MTISALDRGFRQCDHHMILIPIKPKAAETWLAGDMLTKDSDGFFLKCTAGTICHAFAFDPVTSLTTPGTSGDVTVLADVSKQTLYYFAASAAVTQNMTGKTCDVSDAHTIDNAASADDCLLIVIPDVANQGAWVQRIEVALTGVA